MRMSLRVARDLPRGVLPGGLPPDGEMIPAGTNIATDTYALHHNEQILPDPLRFRQERWIVDEKNSKTTAVGKNLAYLELMISLGRVLYRMDMVKVNDD